MEALKWIGYLIAAITVLSVVAGVGLFVMIAVVIGGAIFSVVTLVVVIAASIKESREFRKPL